MQREEVRFRSGGDECAAWLYPPPSAPGPAPCVVMDAGFNRIDTDIREMRGEIGALQRTILQVGSGVGGAMAVGVLGLLATQL